MISYDHLGRVMPRDSFLRRVGHELNNLRVASEKEAAIECITPVVGSLVVNGQKPIPIPQPQPEQDPHIDRGYN